MFCHHLVCEVILNEEVAMRLGLGLGLGFPNTAARGATIAPEQILCGAAANGKFANSVASGESIRFAPLAVYSIDAEKYIDVILEEDFDTPPGRLPATTTFALSDLSSISGTDDQFTIPQRMLPILRRRYEGATCSVDLK